MAPTRVGIFGLRSPATGDDLQSKVGQWAVTAHLSSIGAMPEDYEIVAVCNSTLESAKTSIERNFPGSDVKAYTDPQDIANDPRVELVVISVSVGKHFELAKPALKKGKAIFMEYPIGAGLKESEELNRLANEAGVRTMVGLQARADPLVVKVKEMILSGQIGKVTSSCSALLHYPVTYGSKVPSIIWTSNPVVMSSLSGSAIVILDSFTHVLGDFTDVNTLLKSSFTPVLLINGKGETVNPAYPRTAPDHMFVQGTLEKQVMASITVRKSKSPVDDLGMRWIISGTEGEIEVTYPEGHWQFGDPNRAIRLKIGKTDTQEIGFLSPDDELERKVPFPGTNTARQYRSFAKGDTETCATFESGLKTHRLLDKILRSAGWESV